MRLKALQNQLRLRPSVQAMVQQYLGIEPASNASAREQTDEQIEAEFAQLSQGGLL